jgi:hypothetical protein
METMSRSLSRRSFAAGSIASILGGGVAPMLPLEVLAAHGGGMLEGLDFPALDITMTETGFEGIRRRSRLAGIW